MEGYPSPYPYATIDQALVEAQTALQPPEALVFSEGHQVEHAAVAAVENLPTTRQPRTWYLRLATPPSLVVATNLYPVEATEQLASAARIVSGHLSPYAAEAYQSSHEFTAGSILQTRQFMPITMDPDAVSSAHVFTLGEIYATKTLVPLTMDPDALSSAHVFIAGEILTIGVLTTPNPETMTATARITGGTLE